MVYLLVAQQVKNLPVNAEDTRDVGSNPWVCEDSLEEKIAARHQMFCKPDGQTFDLHQRVTRVDITE